MCSVKVSILVNSLCLNLKSSAISLHNLFNRHTVNRLCLTGQIGPKCNQSSSSRESVIIQRGKISLWLSVKGAGTALTLDPLL